MIRSQEIALRCAAAMDSNLLRRNWMDLRRERYRDAFGITTVKVWRTLTRSFMDQLDRCADDEARRILLGVGEQSGELLAGPRPAKIAPQPERQYASVDRMMELSARIASKSVAERVARVAA